MKTPKKSLAALLAMTLTVGLTACSGETDSQSAQSASSQPAQTTSSSHTQEESGFPFTLTTKDGQEVTFTHVPETIISCNPNAGDELMALGLGDGKPPLLQDLYEELLKQPEPEARRVATALELYCTGSLNLFNHQTNVKLTAHIVCIVLKGLGENLRKIAMHVTNDFVTSAVNVNFHSGVSTWCYFDEFHILLRDALTASYFVAVWKMLRKKSCVPSALTQNVKDLLASREIEAILDNTDFMILLSQAQSDRAILAKQLGISEHQLSYITHSNSGEGLLFYGDVTIPFVDRFPKGEIYNLLTTRPEDLKNEAKTE